MNEMSVASTDTRVVPPGGERTTRYAFYALLILTAANILNYVDRKIISILADAIKIDLQVSDAQIGFLYGTVFAALYAIFGVAMGRLADRISRTRLLASGLAIWSAMTALSGFAASYAHLALARIGVSTGEAVANPCSHSLIADYFRPARRATAYAVYISGTFIGMGLSLAIGGLVLTNWPAMSAALGFGESIKGWQAAFLVCGIPGLILAFAVALLREPQRGGIPAASASSPTSKALLSFLKDILSVIPPTSFFMARRFGKASLVRNLLMAALIVAAAFILVLISGDVAQWAATGVTVYAIFCFSQRLRADAPVLHRMTFGSSAFCFLTIGLSLLLCINDAMLFWAPPHALRTFALSAGNAGLTLGGIMAVATAVGVILGGLLTDRLRQRDLRAPIWIAIFALVLPAPFAAGMYLATDLQWFYICFVMFALLQNVWSGGAAAIVQDMLLPQMRGAGAAIFAMLIIVTTAAIGPYAVGKAGALLGSLSAGALALYVLAPFAIAALLIAHRLVPQAIANRNAAMTSIE